jgi:hypothetical protein
MRGCTANFIEKVFRFKAENEFRVQDSAIK